MPTTGIANVRALYVQNRFTFVCGRKQQRFECQMNPKKDPKFGEFYDSMYTVTHTANQAVLNTQRLWLGRNTQCSNLIGRWSRCWLQDSYSLYSFRLWEAIFGSVCIRMAEVTGTYSPSNPATIFVRSGACWCCLLSLSQHLAFFFVSSNYTRSEHP